MLSLISKARRDMAMRLTRFIMNQAEIRLKITVKEKEMSLGL